MTYITGYDSIARSSVICAYGKEYTDINELLKDQKIINTHGGIGMLHVLNKNSKS